MIFFFGFLHLPSVYRIEKHVKLTHIAPPAANGLFPQSGGKLVKKTSERKQTVIYNLTTKKSNVVYYYFRD